MPIYEYVCRDCGHQFEWLTRGDEKASCPNCGLFHLSRQLSVPAAPRVTSSSAPKCPGREMGCEMPNCCQGNCGLGGGF
jgi:putative FmdB family regulatory protein